MAVASDQESAKEPAVALARLKSRLFTPTQPATTTTPTASEASLDASVRILSAAGEVLEAIEIARLIQQAAAKPITSLPETKKTPSLEYRTLGKTGLKVTVVGMGVMNCSDPAVVLRAFNLGINFYDTADCYMWGKNEEMVGKAFQGKRDKVLIQTKVHENEEKKMRASVERSLRRLKTDYIVFSSGTATVIRRKFLIQVSTNL